MTAGEPWAGLDDRATRRLLASAMGSSGGSLQALIRRLEEGDAKVWFEELLTKKPLGGGPRPAVAILLEGKGGLVELGELKEACKTAHLDGCGDEQLAGAAGYFLAMAAGFVHHRTTLGSYSVDSLREAFLELGSVLPAPWSDLLEGAAELGGRT